MGLKKKYCIEMSYKWWEKICHSIGHQSMIYAFISILYEVRYPVDRIQKGEGSTDRTYWVPYPTKPVCWFLVYHFYPSREPIKKLQK